MDFNLQDQLKNHKSLLINIAFYFMCALLAAVVVGYFIFTFKISDLNQKISALDDKLLVYGSAEQRASEKKVFDYKRKVDDFSTIINNHKVSSNLFDFIEKNTLPKVWFISFSVSEIKEEISLAGEAENMETLSNQIRIFEANKNYITKINVLNSQTTTQGRTRFTINISLNPNIFSADASNAINNIPASTEPAVQN